MYTRMRIATGSIKNILTYSYIFLKKSFTIMVVCDPTVQHGSIRFSIITTLRCFLLISNVKAIKQRLRMAMCTLY